MRFGLDLFHLRADAHVRKAREYLQQAQIARLEHHVAAEHHAALAAMYSQRVDWLEQELANAAGEHAWPPRGMPPQQIAKPGRGPATVVSWLRTRSMDAETVPESA